MWAGTTCRSTSARRLTPSLKTKAPQAAALVDWDRRREYPPFTAVSFMQQVIRENPGEVTLLAVGPMTNVALLFAMDPEIPALLKELVLMCGMFFQAPFGESNAVKDPFATAITYGAGPQGRPPRHVSFGLDVTKQCIMRADECRRRFDAKVLAPVRDFAEVWFNRVDHIVFHDPLAAVCIFEPDICKYVQGKVSLSLQAPTLGWTVFDGQGPDRPHMIASEVDAGRFFSHYFDIVSSKP